jgi:transcriptional regulator with XRE-family HTH domain
MTRAELLSKREYWITQIQIDLYHELEAFMAANHINRTQLAERLGVTKGYVSQVLNGDFDHKISKLVDLALLMGKVPQVIYTDLGIQIKKDERAYTQLRLLEETFNSKPDTGGGAETSMYKKRADKSGLISNMEAA